LREESERNLGCSSRKADGISMVFDGGRLSEWGRCVKGGKIARLLLLRGRAEDAGLNGRDMGGLENCLTVKMQSNGMVCEEGKLVRVMVKSLY
jgi:hypothetical protein